VKADLASRIKRKLNSELGETGRRAYRGRVDSVTAEQLNL